MSQVADPQTILTSLLNDVAALDHAIILVLDDYHVISNQAIHEGMTFLIEHLPQQLHLVIATRADPLLPISRLRARGQLTELRVADLRFTPDEAAAFLNDSMNLGLTAQDVQALEARTEGWIVGLQLAALSMEGRADAHAFIEAFTGSHHYVLEYLADEVLQRQPESLQRFLIETSILNRMCAPLCNAVTERSNSTGVLADLNRRNLFVTPLDSEHYWFRYHHLFAELLNGHLQRLRANDLPALHRRAAHWHEANGDPGDALRHALGYREGLTDPVDGTVMPLMAIATLLCVAGSSALQTGESRRLLAGLLASIVALLLFSRVLHPWYVLPALALGSLLPWRPIVLFALLAPLSYLAYSIGHEPAWLMAAQFAPFLITIALEHRRLARRLA
ncbi:Serine/threonine-protein kinase PknK [Anaerolineae bacterium]|nr:Serine/threonine-protein kinase PknK [Anaerolineae bacterium]